MYEVTATRRRPQHFEDLAGQEFVAETLKNSIKSGQIAHAYLFSGPRGCGKTSTARILAKALNCQSGNGPTAEPCGICESCRAITNSSSLDVIEIDGASNTSVNDVRQIKDEVMFPPNSSRSKIYIIDEVHMLSTNAFNALLKTIEEPPPYVVFIFATTELQKVPATIKSRCQQFNFRLVPIEKVKSLLADAAGELNIQADDEALYWIARESGGSIRDSYTLFDQVAAFSEGHITYDKIRDKLGLLGIEQLNEIFGACAAGQNETAVNKLDSLLQSGISIEQLISNSADYIRSLLLIKSGIRKESLLGQSSERFSADVLNTWNPIQVERALSIFLQLYRDIRYSLSPRYELELAFSRLCWLKQYVSPAEVKAAVDAAHSLLEGTAPNADSANTAQYNPAPPSGQTSAATGSGAAYSSGQQFNNSAAPSGIPAFSAIQQPMSAQNTAQAVPTQMPPAAEAVSSEPAGIPHFSALAHSGQPPQPQEPSAGAAAPFHNGGALPPEQTAAAASSPLNGSASTAYPPSGNSTAQYSGNSSSGQTSYDDWSNEEVPPDEDYAYEEPYEEQQNESAAAVSAEPDSEQGTRDIHHSDAVYVTPDGESITITKLYGAVISELSVEDALLASALMQTGKWNISGNKITTSIGSIYQKSMLEQNIQKILSCVNKYCRSDMQFEIILQEPQIQNQEPAELPLQVKILCNVFKGSILGGKR